MPQLLNFFKALSQRGLGAPFVVVAMLGMMIIPLPAMALDMLFTFNIAISLVVLLVTVYALRPLDFAVFPTVILIATLLRLALNVASTRVVLLEGHTGSAAAGKVIEAFGEFVIGGNFAVGFVVFAILVIINFAVVTKGAGRISEVSARFTLDALPGKQMAIDADLNAGLIEQDEAKLRRKEVAMEAEFYGSMDGASKFVKGDAIAGLVILVINIIGGFAIGMGQHDLALADAARNYTLLTIGDGLVAQIPSLVLSTAAGILVTRVSVSEDMGSQIFSQMLANPMVMYVTGGVIGGMGLIPGMPNLAFITFGAICGGVGYMISRKHEQEEQEVQALAALEQQAQPVEKPENRELSWEDVPPVDVIGLEVGYGLIPLVDRNQGGQLLARIKGVRKKLSQELGFLIQPVHIRDNLDLAPNVYRINILGVPVGEAQIYADREMAINPGNVNAKIDGIATTDPAFGLEAVWIMPNQRDRAQALGFTVVDASTVVATHLSQLLQENAHEILGYDEVQKLLDVLANSSPKLVEELVPNTLPLSVVTKVLQSLLEENVPIRDMRSIVETLAQVGPTSQDPSTLMGFVRQALGRHIVQNIVGMDEELPVIALDPGLEQLLLQTLQGGSEAGIEPGLADQLLQSLADVVQRQEMSGQPAVLLTAPQLRLWVARMARNSSPGLHVLSYNEVPDNKKVSVIATVGDPKNQAA